VNAVEHQGNADVYGCARQEPRERSAGEVSGTNAAGPQGNVLSKQVVFEPSPDSAFAQKRAGTKK